MTVKLRVGQKIKDSLGHTWEVVNTDYRTSFDTPPGTYFQCVGINNMVREARASSGTMARFYARYKDFTVPMWEDRFHFIKPGPETLDDLIEL